MKDKDMPRRKNEKMKTLTAEEIEKRIADSYELPNNVLMAVPEPMVTVRTSTYQHGSFIRECIESVLAQKTTFPFEFIIGEDFSTDGTREIVFEYAKKHPDIIRVITADYNVGMKSNGRRCRQAARGKYLATCEGDDYWTDPTKLQQQVDILEAHPEYSLCFHNARVEYMDSGRPSHPFAKYDKEIYTIDDVVCTPWFVPTQSIMHRRELFNTPEWTSYIFNGDFATQLLFADKGPFYCINKEMSVYRRHSTSLGATTAIHRATFNRIQNLHYFDMYTNFKYHDLIAQRELELIEPLYKAFLYEKSKCSKLLSVDYYKFKIDALQEKLKIQIKEDGFRAIPRICSEFIARLKGKRG